MGAGACPLVLACMFWPCVGVAQSKAVGVSASPNPQDVVWAQQGRDYRDSMPIGNGDMGANVWTEQDGDVVLLLGKTDAFTENGELVKLGRVRISTNPVLFAGPKFVQRLEVHQGAIAIRSGTQGVLRIWVDANHPVIHIELKSEKPVKMTAKVELWRLRPRETRQGRAELSGRAVLRELNNIPGASVTIEPDSVFPDRADEIMWAHHNTRSVYPMVLQNQHLDDLIGKYPDPLLYRTFGAAMKGQNMAASGSLTLGSKRPDKKQRIDIYELTERSENLEGWKSSLDNLVERVSAVDLETAWSARRAWWSRFWSRSWIEVSGSADASAVTQGYAMQRYMDAAGGRGSVPIKYNGSIFTVGQEPREGTYDPAKGQRDADYRDWGSNFWLQNTRLLYWPLITSGDYDLLEPFFKMYRDDLPLELERNRIYFKQPGVSYPETMYFWGTPGNGDFGWGNPDVVMTNTWIRYYVDGGLEVTAMMLDRYANTLDEKFLEDTLLPVADAVTTYYDNHWPRLNGKLHMDPAQSLETRQQAVNPTPDIAALQSVLPRLLALPERSTTPAQRAMWRQMLDDLPPITTGRTDTKGKIPEMGADAAEGKPVILPAEKYSKPANVENTELYAVFPYQIYGVGLRDLDVARNTYDARVFKSSTCWGQDGMDAAILGLASSAKAEAVANLTDYGGEQFKWFWKAGHDWEPDMDNGGAGMSTLQLMLLQERGNKMLLFPAWPKDWNVRFKLLGAEDTTVEGVYQNGQLTSLHVTPENRAKDLIQMTPQ
jgi:alpha-L-fucosidase 2